MNLESCLLQITPADEAARKTASQRWNACAKPLGSLGLLEDAIIQVAGLTGSADIDISRRALLVFCADNGVVAQGISQSPSSVTATVLDNLSTHCSSVCPMARCADCEVIPIDMGVLDYPGRAGVLSRRVRNGTNDISLGPAMTRDEAQSAILTGIELVRELQRRGMRLIATGEMGIGNTTTSSAVASVLLRLPVEQLTGRGAGLSDVGLARKKEVIHRAIRCNAPDPDDAIDVLSKVGGLDIAALCGTFLGGALFGVPVLIDGFISSAAALCALRLAPNSAKAMLASHVSAEPAGRLMLDALGKEPLITARMRLGEGTGAVAAIPLLDMAAAVYQEACRFDDCGIEQYKPLGGF